MCIHVLFTFSETHTHTHAHTHQTQQQKNIIFRDDQPTHPPTRPPVRRVSLPPGHPPQVSETFLRRSVPDLPVPLPPEVARDGLVGGQPTGHKRDVPPVPAARRVAVAVQRRPGTTLTGRPRYRRDETVFPRLALDPQDHEGTAEVPDPPSVRGVEVPALELAATPLDEHSLQK